MSTTAPRLVFPTATGRAALAELTRVPWSELSHAYGKGNVGSGLHEDVQASLTMLGERGREAFDEALDTLFSNIFHQGTIYEATAYAVPFLAAFIADPAVPARRARGVGLLLGAIAIASSIETEDGSHSGSFGEGVAEHTRQAFSSSDASLRAAEAAFPALRRLVAAIAELVATEAPTDEDRARVADLFELLEQADADDEDEEDEDGDDEQAVPAAAVFASVRVSHPKFGQGSLTGRDGDKARVSFDDGVERLLLERFLTVVALGLVCSSAAWGWAALVCAGAAALPSLMAAWHRSRRCKNP